MTGEGEGAYQNWRTQRISMRLRLKSNAWALDSRTWLENATWGLKPNTVIARLSSVAPRMRVWSLRAEILGVIEAGRPWDLSQNEPKTFTAIRERICRTAQYP